MRGKSIHKGLLKFSRARRAVIGLQWVFVLSCTFGWISVYADVFLKDTNILLPSEDGVIAAPGGKRSMCMNGSCYTAVRVYAKTGVEDQFVDQWKKLNNNNGMTAEIALRNAVFQVQPDASDNPPSSIGRVIEQAIDGYRETYQLTSEALEQPFAYEAGGWQVISRLPVSSYLPSSKLGELEVTDGYIMMKDPTDTAVPGFWVLRFLPGFNLLDIFSSHEGDAPGSDHVDIPRSPDTRRILHLSERADRWVSENWVYEGQGSPEYYAEFYRKQFLALGYVPSSTEIVSGSNRFLQYRDVQQQHDVGLFTTSSSDRPQASQIVLQIRKSY